MSVFSAFTGPCRVFFKSVTGWTTQLKKSWLLGRLRTSWVGYNHAGISVRVPRAGGVKIDRNRALQDGGATRGQPGTADRRVDKQTTCWCFVRYTTGASMGAVSIFLVGDVMLARGIDMILKYSCDPKLYEGNGLDARDYVALAVTKHGALPDKKDRGVDYIWGDAIEILEEKNPDLRVINLETSVTTNDAPWPRKGIHYRMHPGNVEVIKAAKIDCCMLANNHTADWGFQGLLETLKTLHEADIPFVGAGKDINEAQSPAIFDLPGKGRVVVFGFGHTSSGIPDKWTAGPGQCGLNMIELGSSSAITKLRDQVRKVKQKGDVVVLSIHWGGNWGFDIEPDFQTFAHEVIDQAGVDMIHGHSSHHVRGIEVYKDKVIIYGCGDFLDDYEGISGYDEYRGDLSLMYFVSVDPATGNLTELKMVPTEIRHMKVNRAKEKDIHWLETTMRRECKKLGTDVERVADELHLVW